MNLFVIAESAEPILGIDPWVALALAVFFVFLNGFFVAAEFALVKVRPTQIEVDTSRRGRLANEMIRRLDAYLSATQLGITLASLALGWVGEPAFAGLMSPLLDLLPSVTPAVTHTVSLGLAFAVITVLHIVVGELAPKSFAIRKPESTSLWIAIPLEIFFKITYPAIVVLNGAANRLLKLVGLEPATEGDLAHSEEEVRRLVASHEGSSLSDEKRELLDNIFQLSERTARQIMVPRSEVVFLSTSRSMDENLEIARTSGHTRFPLCDEDLDHVEGIIHIKDLFHADQTPSSLENLQRRISFVPETLPADHLLRRMRGEKVHMAAVIDEFGGVSGIVTLENALEEIVGEIQDEFDTEPPELVKTGPDTYQVSGSILIAELEDELQVELSDRDEDTIAGVVLSELGRRARVDDHVMLPTMDLTVKAIDGNRIVSLKLEVKHPEQGLSVTSADI